VASSIYTCPSCSTTNTALLNKPVVLICRQCGEIAYTSVTSGRPPKARAIPPDWSFLQPGSSGVYGNEPFSLIGRIRLQLRNDYKNLWCALLKDGNHLWLMESFCSFSVFTLPWKNLDMDVRHLHAGKTIKLSPQLVVKGEYVEKCERIALHGEIGDWKMFSPGFFFIQASNNAGQTVIFTIDEKENIECLGGKTVEVESLQLKNILVWDEWK
jgi:hypothetical protein